MRVKNVFFQIKTNGEVARQFLVGNSCANVDTLEQLHAQCFVDGPLENRIFRQFALITPLLVCKNQSQELISIICDCIFLVSRPRRTVRSEKVAFN